ncbi:MAG TPA: hypothetical protein PK643_09480, partial [Saprospiraceae bacterium]|nr:hypothetical protein [Saprospiraceae bacterium]
GFLMPIFAVFEMKPKDTCKARLNVKRILNLVEDLYVVYLHVIGVQASLNGPIQLRRMNGNRINGISPQRSELKMQILTNQ